MAVTDYKAYAKTIDDEREAFIELNADTSFNALNEQAGLVAQAVRERGVNAAPEAVTLSEPLVSEMYEDIYSETLPHFAEILYLAYHSKAYKQVGEFLEKWLAVARALILTRPIQRRVKLVQQETIDRINEITQIGLAEGLSVDRIADLIDGTEYGRPVEGRFPLVDPYTGPPVFDTTVRQRAQRIARTETMAAANAGTRQGVIDTGLNLRHYWISIYDNRTRDSHDTRHPLGRHLADPRPMNEPYVLASGVSLMFPSDPNAQGDERSVAAETIQCRCVEGYEVI